MTGPVRIGARFLVAGFCFKLAADRIGETCPTVGGDCLGRLGWESWGLLGGGALLLLLGLVALVRRLRHPDAGDERG